LVRLNTPSTSTVSKESDETAVKFEIFVQDRFSELEVSSAVATLEAANQILAEDRFQWSFVSETPGLVESRNGMMVRAEPVVFDHKLKDFLIVVGGGQISTEDWMPRVRATQRNNGIVAILSDAATAFIKTLRSSDRNVTTHWHDIRVLEETGSYPNLSTRYAETSSRVVTSAGSSYTSELIIRLISDYLSPKQYSEIGSRLLLQSVRDPQSEQPKGTSYLMNAFGPQVSAAIHIMEDNLAEPISTREISEQVGLSVRQLERLFSKHFGISPARYYKKVRVGKAHALVTESNMNLIDVAIATGFSSVPSLTNAYRIEFGNTPKKARGSRGHA